MKWLISVWGDPSGWKEVEYNYRGKTIKSANHLGLVQEVEKPDETLIMLSDSLAYPSAICIQSNTYEDLKNRLEHYIREKYIKQFQIKDARLIIFPGGKGTYKWRPVGERLIIEGESGDLKYIVLWNIIQTLEKNLEKVLEKGNLEVIFDASHGWNFVPITVYQTLWLVLEILSFFGVDVTFRMIASEPFVDEKTPLNVVEIEKRKVPYSLYNYFRTKEGYSSALKPTNYGKKIEKNLGKLRGELNRFINSEYQGAVVNDIPLIIGAFYNGLPLAVKTFYNSPEKVKPLIDKLLEVYFKGIEISIDGNLTTLKRIFAFSPYTEVLLISYLYNLLTKALGNPSFLERKDITFIEELREFACRLFAKDEKKLIAITTELGDCEGKTKGFIISAIEKAIKTNRCKELEVWKPLKEIIQDENENEANEANSTDNKNEQTNRGNDKRNFLAHAGLSRAEIEVKILSPNNLNDGICIRYNPDRLEQIKNWVQTGLTEIE